MRLKFKSQKDRNKFLLAVHECLFIITSLATFGLMYASLHYGHAWSWCAENFCGSDSPPYYALKGGIEPHWGMWCLAGVPGVVGLIVLYRMMTYEHLVKGEPEPSPTDKLP